jgi:hypothetical protein
MLQRALAWLILLAHAALAVYALIAFKPFAQPVWTPAGLERLAFYLSLFAALSGAVLLLRARWYSAVFTFVGLAYSCYAAGPLAVFAVLYLLLSAYCAGRLILRKVDRPSSTTNILTLLTGFCIYLVWFLLTLRFPIHYAWFYWIALALPVVLAFRSGVFPPLAVPRGSDEFGRSWPLALLWMPLLANWLLALKPEVSPEGLARHLVFAAHLATQHLWTFDVTQFTWAVFPTGGESLFGLAYLLGGESAARLLNFSLLAALCWMLYERLHRRVPAWIAGGLAGGLAAMPLTPMVTASLGVENWVAVFLLGAVLLLRLHKREQHRVYAWCSAALAGGACACHVSGFAFLLPFFIAFASMTLPGTWMPCALLALAIAGFPYLEALWHTGNPVFPYFNNFFRSEAFDSQAAFSDSPFHQPLSFRVLYDMTFHSRRFSEGFDGAFGYTLFLLLPAAVAGAKRRWPRTGFVLLWMVLAGAPVVLLAAPELRLLYPAVPLSILLIGIAIGSYRLHGAGLARAFGWLALAAYGLGFALFPAAGGLHRDFIFDPRFLRASVAGYLIDHAPERPLVQTLRARHPSTAVAFLESANVGDYAGRVFTNSWRTPDFSRRLYESSNVSGLNALSADQMFNLGYFISYRETPTRHLTVVPSREFLDRYTQLVQSFGDAELRRWIRPQPGVTPPEQVWAGPGPHDDLDPAIHFEGQWARLVDLPRSFRNTLVHTSDLTARAEIRFEGRAIRLVYTAAANRCRCVVNFNYLSPRDFDEYSEHTQWQAVSPRFEAPEPGRNVLVLNIASAGAALSSAAGACHLDLDGFIVE